MATKMVMNILPDDVRNKLIEFLANIPVVKFSEDWKAIQVAISMITAPRSFKKGVHVYLNSHDGAREPGCYNISDMSIKIWPNKIQMRRTHREYVSGSDIDINQTFRYIYPSDKYGMSAFKEVMSNLGDLFYGSYSQEDSDYSGSYSIAANFHIETNVK